MPNPSELACLEEHLHELQQDLRLNNHWPKAQKEGLLRQIHELERLLGKKHRPYNGG